MSDVARFAVTVLAATALLLSGCINQADQARDSGLVEGYVLTAPVCPVERFDQECPARPVPGAEVVALDGGAVRASTITDNTGAFQLTVPGGRYVIRATNVDGYASTATQEVAVSDTPRHITLVVDSGIR
ncbi:carboxypeptidase-like regulatory domain-containing protein [Arthrobacter sp. R4-81]